MSFKREERYMIVKDKDAMKYLDENDLGMLNHIMDKVAQGRAKDSKQQLVCVVVESDWPEYEPTWAAIEARMVPNDTAKGSETAWLLSFPLERRVRRRRLIWMRLQTKFAATCQKAGKLP